MVVGDGLPPPATDEQATAQARQRLGEMLASLAAQGIPVESALGSSSPIEAMEQVLSDHQFDEIIVATLPQSFSRWLGADLPGRRNAGSACRSPPSPPSANRAAWQLVRGRLRPGAPGPAERARCRGSSRGPSGRRKEPGARGVQDEHPATGPGRPRSARS